MLCIILALFFMMKVDAIGQDHLRYTEDKTQVSFGITAGTLFIYADVELSLALTRRYSESVVLEFRPSVGFIGQTYRFEQNQELYHIFYGGTALGILLGKDRTFLEFHLGSAYFHDSSGSWGGSENRILPTMTMSIRRLQTKLAFRIGFGFPQGAFVSLNF